MQELDKARELFIIGNSVDTISKKIGLPKKDISKFIEENGITLPKIEFELNIEENKKKCIEWYLSGSSTVSIGKIFGISKGRVQRLLEANGVELRDFTDSKIQLSFNEEIFNIIDSHEKAYWLGYLQNRVSLSDSSTRIVFDVTLVERSQLERFAKLVELDFNQIQDVCIMERDYSRISVPSKHLHSNIFNEIIPDEYVSSYVRGVFDANGDINSHGKNDEYRLVIYPFSGRSEKITNWIKNTCSSSFRFVDGSDKRTRRDEIHVSGNEQIHRIMNSIYRDSSDLTRVEENYSRYKVLCEKQSGRKISSIRDSYFI